MQQPPDRRAMHGNAMDGVDLAHQCVERQIALRRKPLPHPGRVQPVMAQSADEGLGAPMPEGGVVDKALAARCPTGGLGHVGFDGGFIDERQPFQMVGHEGLAFHNPDMVQFSHILALLLKGLQVFFYASSQGDAATVRPPSDAR